MLNAYFTLGHNPGGFRVWWRRWHDYSDETLDNAHLMRMAGRFARRVRGVGGRQRCAGHRLRPRGAQAPHRLRFAQVASRAAVLRDLILGVV